MDEFFDGLPTYNERNFSLYKPNSSKDTIYYLPKYLPTTEPEQECQG